MKLRLLTALLLTACERHPPVPPQTSPPLRVTPPNGQPGLRVPQVLRPPVLEQHDDETLWQSAVTTGPWQDPATHAPARPYSRARLLWDTQHLYLQLYAADQNITDHEAFAVQLQADRDGATAYALEIAPTGTLTDARVVNGQRDATWESAAHVAMDMDGSLNDANGEDDEEWVAFVALPWNRLGLLPSAEMRLRLQLSRCDVPKDGVKRCGAWAQTVALAGAAPAR